MNTLGQIKPIIGITGTNGKTSSILMANLSCGQTAANLDSGHLERAANFYITKQLQAEAWVVFW